MSAEFYYQLLALISGMGFFVGLAWNQITKDGPFSGCGAIERFFYGIVISVPISMLFAIVYSVIWGAVRLIYFGVSGN
jgi:hypothetical protein